MFNMQSGMEQPFNNTYNAPDVSDIKSWGLEKLEDEFGKIEDERLRLIKKVERPNGTTDANVVIKIKELAIIGREMFAELEIRKRTPTT